MFSKDIINKLKIYYRSVDDNIIKDFYIPVISNAIKYDRSVGYFSSKILVSYVDGLKNFIKNNGKMRLLISPSMLKEDILELDPKKCAKETIINLLNLCNSSDDIVNISSKIFAKLIHLNILDVKVVVPKNKVGIFHEKISIFYDEANNKIATNGSNNETLNSVSANLESFNVFGSWNVGQNEYINAFENSFAKTWNNDVKYYDVISLKNAIEDNLLSEYVTNDSIESLYHSINHFKDKKSSTDNSENENISLNFTPYKYQKDAALEWVEKKQGIISFATGTGKTKTAIYAIKTLIDKNLSKAFVIVVPNKTLVVQWYEELKSYFSNVVKCYSESPHWNRELKNKIKYLKLNKLPNLFVVSTNNTFFGNKMNKQIKKLNNDFVFIADECHRLGTDRYLSQLKIQASVERRMGLSATPEIYMSKDNTQNLYNFFKGIVAKYSLSDAINNGKLTKYNYYPIHVSLEDNELSEYKKITNEIVKLWPSFDEILDFDKIPKQAQIKLFERSRIIYGAQNKLQKLDKLMGSMKNSKHILIYCGATNVNEVSDDYLDDETYYDKQITMVNNMLMKKHIDSAQYTKEENEHERIDRINEFKNGNLKVLVAIKALDEGVDIPEISTGIIMASSGNPREFIQRRGRMLRLYKGKKIVNIYDMVVLGESPSYDGINSTEIKRIREFTNNANNKAELEIKYKSMFYKYLGDEVNE
ncbi:DEAD/DEAH box helicase family protein [Apilactobacillus xinyiensis]|uniref:DEAD/DEAH box helicase family protein n=1 Tax=Apilactobacillus xinyiensis TaxID=2841032 RepID=UPI001C7D84B7|nr:DEAD/DEAH box helicase family protein [Apilactobacillus xinyiensis]